MVGVFQIPTLVLFLARLRVVTARWLWAQVRHAVLVAFIVSAVLTPSPDPWNQAVFAAPMIVLYVVSIAIAWIVAPKKEAQPASGHLKLVFTAAVIDQASRHTRRRTLDSRNWWRAR